MGFVRGIVPSDLSVCRRAASFLQSPEWGQFKARFGWQARAFLLDWDCSGQGEKLPEQPLLVLVRRIAPGCVFAYVPWGPELPDAPGDRQGALAEIAAQLRARLPRTTVFIRFDPPWFVETAGRAAFPPFRRAAADIQPPDTALVDLRPSSEEIRAAMKPKWRYNIGLAEKKGVTIERRDRQGIDVFYRLLEETAARDGIAIHGIEYYSALFDVFAAEARLYAACHDGDTLAAIVVLFRGKTATYLYGASSNVKRNLMAPYALQWRAMCDAKEAGCAVYDLFGIPPDDSPDHPMAGLYRFKTGFGGAIVHRPGSLDYPARPFLYTLFTAAENARKKLRDKKKRR